MEFEEVNVLEILKRARGASDGELTSWGHNPPAGLQDELNQRTFKAGYTDREGHQKISRKTKATSGKGDWCRPMDNNKYRKNYEIAFGHE